VPGFLLSCLPEKALVLVTYLVKVVVMVLHALDRDVFPSFYALSFEYLRKGPLALFANQTIL
jgi:hypothetical protein